MKRCLALAAFLTFCITIIAQKASTPGYYVNNLGDTIQGNFGRLNQWGNSPSQMEFVTSDNRVTRLTPQNCRLFHITDQNTYIAYHGLRMTSPLEDDQPSLTTIPDSYDTISTFLKIIYQNNEVTLYSYKDKLRSNIFIKKGGKDITELERKLGIYFSGTNRRTNFIDKYKEQLREEFRSQINAKKLHYRLNTLGYSDKDLVKFMDLLYSTRISEKNNIYPAKLFIGAGAAFGALNMIADKSHFESLVDHASPVSPVLAIGAKFFARQTKGRLFISPRIIFNTFSAKGNVELTSAGQPFSHSSSYKTNLMITTAANIGYNLISKTDLKWHVSAGAGFIFISGPKETQTTNWINGTQTVVVNEGETIVFVPNLETGVDIGKNFGLWANYQLRADLMKYVNKYVEYTSLKVGVSFFFTTRK